MRKFFLIAVLFVAAGAVKAQKFAYVDTDYILNKIPSYTAALKELEDLSQKYRDELQQKMSAIEEMYQAYQNDLPRLSEAARRTREDEIMAREQEHRELQQRHFGQDGTLARRQEELLGPIQRRVSEAISGLAAAGGYDFIFDRAGGSSIVYTNAEFNMSDQVLQRLGY